MNLKLETEFSKADVFERIDALKKQVDDARPLAPDVEGRVMQKLRLEWNYNSNAIEGNKLSYGETTALLMHGITAKGKPLKDHLDIQGHNAAIDLLINMVQDERPLNETDIRGLHEKILGEPRNAPAQTADGKPTTKLITPGVYKATANHVKTEMGEIHYYASPEETPAKMQELMTWYYETLTNKEIHPIVIASLFHHRFVAIHPFDDGNGRMARILMNLILMRAGYPVAVIKNDNKNEYYSLLSRADVGELWPFVEYIIDRVENSLELYIKAINGESIDEADDIDKEITLFKLQIKNNADLSQKKSVQVVNKVIMEQINPFLQRVVEKLNGFDELFFSNKRFLRYRFNEKLPSVYATMARDEIDNNIIPIFKLATKEIFRQEFHCEWKNFKSSTRMFDVELTLNFDFEDYTYVINDVDNKILIKKFYHEAILNPFQDDIIKAYVDVVKKKIEKQFNNKKA